MLRFQKAKDASCLHSEGALSRNGKSQVWPNNPGVKADKILKSTLPMMFLRRLKGLQRR